MIFGAKILDLTGDTNCKLTCIESPDGVYSTLSFYKIVPVCVGSDADGRDRSHTGYDYLFHGIMIPSLDNRVNYTLLLPALAIL